MQSHSRGRSQKHWLSPVGKNSHIFNIKLAKKMAGSSGFFCSGTSTFQSLPEGEQEIELEESEKDHGSGKLLHRSDPVEMVLWGWDQVCTLYQETLVPVVSCFFPCWYSCFGCPHQSQHQECVEVGITVTDSPMVDLAQSWPSWGMTANLAEK